jgi:thiosulfate sulfurtransferase
MTFKCISIDEAKALIDKGSVTIADVRDADTYLAGNIESAINIQQDSMDGFLAAADRDQPLLVYCYHGNSSQGAADYFFNQGFEDVYSMDGGYEAWRLKY